MRFPVATLIRYLALLERLCAIRNEMRSAPNRLLQNNLGDVIVFEWNRPISGWLLNLAYND